MNFFTNWLNDIQERSNQNTPDLNQKIWRNTRNQGFIPIGISIDRPYSGIGNDEFYPSPEEKAAAIIESVVKNHPFNDGNKRTGYVLMRLILLQNNKDIQATKKEKYHMVMEIASGNLGFDKILEWIRNKTVEM